MRDFKKLIIFIRLPLVFIFFLSQGIFISNAYAYLDPGSGSVIIQLIIGALIGIGVTMKLYWVQLKYKLSSIFSTSKNDQK